MLRNTLAMFDGVFLWVSTKSISDAKLSEYLHKLQGFDSYKLH